MFYYVKGTVAHVAPFLAVIDCGGVGYACRTTNTTLSRLEKGAPATLYTHLNVREDAMELYGFYSENELNCFRMLIGVSGVGPKAALAIALCHARSYTSRLQSPDAARPGSGRYAVRKD